MRVCLGWHIGSTFFFRGEPNGHAQMKWVDVLEFSLTPSLPQLLVPGLHKFADDIIFSTLKANATTVYIAPEYANTCRFTEKNDVLSFGIVVLHVVTSRRVVSQLKVGTTTSDLKGLIDPKLGGIFSRTKAAKLTVAAAHCMSEAASHKPTMDDVVQQLSG